MKIPIPIEDPPWSRDFNGSTAVGLEAQRTKFIHSFIHRKLLIW